MRIGTTLECEYIGGHAKGFDPECHWCVAHKQDLAALSLDMQLGITDDACRYPTPDEWAAFVRTYLTNPTK